MTRKRDDYRVFPDDWDLLANVCRIASASMVRGIQSQEILWPKSPLIETLRIAVERTDRLQRRIEGRRSNPAAPETDGE